MGTGDLLTAMREVIDLGAEWVLVTDGPHPAWLASRTESYRLTPPPVEVVNPIGCGDCVAAGIAIGIARGEDVPSAVRLGLAAAADNATRMLPARLDPACIRELHARIAVERT